jgi:hypothetical protein
MLNYNLSTFRGHHSSYEGQTMVKCSLDWITPIQYGVFQPLTDWAIYRGLALSAYTESGSIWPTSFSGTQDSILTAGAELSFLFTTVGDIKIPITVGYGQTVTSITMSSAISLYQLVFGY